MPPVLQNFRGRRALLLQRPSGAGQRLEADLRRLGLLVGCVDPESAGGPDAGDLYRHCDILFFDADHGSGELLPKPLPDIPLVAIVGVEAPSRLSRVVRMRAAAVLIKPIGSTGLFTALFVAFNEHAARCREAAELRTLQARLRGRRFVVKAVLKLMRERGLDDETAFHVLRRESMRRRLSLEDLCRALVADTGEAAAEQLHPSAETKEPTISKEDVR